MNDHSPSATSAAEHIGADRAPAHVPPPQQPAPAVRRHLRDAVQHHGFRHRHDASRTPTRIMPPAMPKMPDRSDVPTIARQGPRSEAGSWRLSRVLSMIPKRRAGKLSYRRLSLSFSDAVWSASGFDWSDGAIACWISFPDGCHAQAALSQWHPGVRGGGARRKLRQGRRRTACHAGRDQPDGAASRAAARRAAVRAQGEPARADARRAAAIRPA